MQKIMRGFIENLYPRKLESLEKNEYILKYISQIKSRI